MQLERQISGRVSGWTWIREQEAVVVDYNFVLIAGEFLYSLGVWPLTGST